MAHCSAAAASAQAVEPNSPCSSPPNAANSAPAQWRRSEQLRQLPGARQGRTRCHPRPARWSMAPRTTSRSGRTPTPTPGCRLARRTGHSVAARCQGHRRLESHVALGIAHLQEVVAHPLRHASDVARVGPARAEIGQGLIRSPRRAGLTWATSAVTAASACLLLAAWLSNRPTASSCFLQGGAAVTIRFRSRGGRRTAPPRRSPVPSSEMDRQQPSGPRRLDVFESLGHEDGLVEGSPGCRRSKAARKMAASGFRRRPRWTGSLASPAVGKRRPGRTRPAPGDTPGERPHLSRAARHLPVRHQTGEDGQTVASRTSPSASSSRWRPAAAGWSARPAGCCPGRTGPWVISVGSWPRFASAVASRLRADVVGGSPVLALGVGENSRRTNTSRMTSTLRRR